MSDDAPKPPGRRGSFDEGHGNERFTLDNIMSEREQARIAGEAIAGHIWDSMEAAMGGTGSFRQGVVTDAWADAMELRNSPGGKNLDIRADPDDDDYPVVHIQGSGPRAHLTFRHPIGGLYMDVYHQGEAVDTIHMGDDKAERRNPRFIRQRAEEYEPWDYE